METILAFIDNYMFNTFMQNCLWSWHFRHASGHGTASDGISLYKPVAANDMLKRAEVSFGQLEVLLIDYGIPNPTKFIA